jgi:hypothetical protein
MRFKLWMERVESGHDFWEKFFLAAWRLNKASGGLAVPLTGLDPKAITQTSAYQQRLSPPQQEEIGTRLAQGRGTVGDLVNVAVNPQNDAF